MIFRTLLERLKGLSISVGNSFTKTLLLLAAAAFAETAAAGPFNTFAYTDASIDRINARLVEIVTSKFTTKYPAKSYGLVVSGSAYIHADGSASYYALVGVARLVKGKPLFPENRNVSLGTLHGEDVRLLADMQIEAIAKAATDMMFKCERTKNCDLD